MEYKPSIGEYIFKEFPIQVGIAGLAIYTTLVAPTLHAASETNSNSLRALGIAITCLDSIALCLLTKLCCNLEDNRKPRSLDNTATP